MQRSVRRPHASGKHHSRVIDFGRFEPKIGDQIGRMVAQISPNDGSESEERPRPTSLSSRPESSSFINQPQPPAASDNANLPSWYRQARVSKQNVSHETVSAESGLGQSLHAALHELTSSLPTGVSLTFNRSGPPAMTMADAEQRLRALLLSLDRLSAAPTTASEPTASSSSASRRRSSGESTPDASSEDSSHSSRPRTRSKSKLRESRARTDSFAEAAPVINPVSQLLGSLMQLRAQERLFQDQLNRSIGVSGDSLHSSTPPTIPSRSVPRSRTTSSRATQSASSARSRSTQREPSSTVFESLLSWEDGCALVSLAISFASTLDRLQKRLIFVHDHIESLISWLQQQHNIQLQSAHAPIHALAEIATAVPSSNHLAPPASNLLASSLEVAAMMSASQRLSHWSTSQQRWRTLYESLQHTQQLVADQESLWTSVAERAQAQVTVLQTHIQKISQQSQTGAHALVPWYSLLQCIESSTSDLNATCDSLADLLVLSDAAISPQSPSVQHRIHTCTDWSKLSCALHPHARSTDVRSLCTNLLRHWIYERLSLIVSH